MRRFFGGDAVVMKSSFCRATRLGQSKWRKNKLSKQSQHKDAKQDGIKKPPKDGKTYPTFIESSINKCQVNDNSQ